MEKPEKGEEEGEKERAYAIRATRVLRKCVAVMLTFAVWLFLAQFLLQFVHKHDDDRSLPGFVQILTDSVQVPFENALGFDLRYEFPNVAVDFMPLVIFVGLLVLRNRSDFLLAKAECKLKGVAEEAPPPIRSRGSSFVLADLKGQAPDARKSRGDDRASLTAKIFSIYSE